MAFTFRWFPTANATCKSQDLQSDSKSLSKYRRTVS